MFNSTDFPEPTLISVNGVELEVLKQVNKMQENLLYSAMAGRSTHFHGVIRYLLLSKQAIMSSSRTSGVMATHPVPLK